MIGALHKFLCSRKDVFVKLILNLKLLLLLPLSVVFLISSSADAGTVAKVFKKSRRVIIKDLEDGDGIEKGARVCIYKENGKRAACGKVGRIKNEKAYMKVSKKRIRRVKKGMAARSPDAAPSQGELSQAVSSSSKTGSMRFNLFWAGAVISPYSFQKLTYVVPESEARSSLWNQEGAVTTQLFGVGLSAGFVVGPGMLITGLRYRASDDIAIDSDYSATDSNIYTSMTESASSMGLFVDYGYMTIPMGSMFALDLKSGLDIDMSTVKLAATVKDDSGASEESDLASVESKLTIASLRLGAGLDALFLGPVGINLGVNVLVPLMVASEAFSGSVTDSQETTMDEDTQTEDMKTQLAHEKSGFGAEIVLGLVARF